MRKNVWLFSGGLILLSGAGVLLRSIELRTALDNSTMLMDFGAVSLILLLLSAAALGLLALLARKGMEEPLPRRYVLCFGGIGSLAVSAVSLLLTVAGALFCLRSRGADAGMRLFRELLALLAVLCGAAWLALGLDGWRKKKEDSFLSAVLPVIFCGTFLVLFYKTYAQLPALLYILYPFLGLCAAVAGVHLIAGFSLGRVRARLTLFFCGAGAYLCIVSLPGVKDVSFQLFLGAIALELAAHGVCLLLPHPPEPEQQEEAETPKEDGEAEAEKAPETPEAEAQEAPEAEASQESQPE